MKYDIFKNGMNAKHNGQSVWNSTVWADDLQNPIAKEAPVSWTDKQVWDFIDGKKRPVTQDLFFPFNEAGRKAFLKFARQEVQWAVVAESKTPEAEGRTFVKHLQLIRVAASPAQELEEYHREDGRTSYRVTVRILEVIPAASHHKQSKKWD